MAADAPTTTPFNVGQEDISYLSDNDLINYLNGREDGIVCMIKNIICNRYHQYNMNVVYQKSVDKAEEWLWIRKKDEWDMCKPKDAFESIIFKCYRAIGMAIIRKGMSYEDEVCHHKRNSLHLMDQNNKQHLVQELYNMVKSYYSR